MGRVVVANPRQVRLIAEARITTDVIDATVLARLCASTVLPAVWVPDQRTHARTMLVEAAWQAVRGPGPRPAFDERLARRGATHVAAVAVARQRAVIVWHLLRRGADDAWVRPALHAKTLRELDLRSGQPARRGQRGAACADNLTRTRLEAKRRAEQAAAAYRRPTERWTRPGPKLPTAAATEERLWERL